MKKQMWIMAASTVLITSLTGCGSLKTRDYQAAEVQRVQKAAVVSFSVDAEAPSEISLTKSSSSTGSRIEQQDPSVDGMYEDMIVAFSQNLNWKMTPAAALKNSAAYRAAYDSKMKGIQMKMTAGGGRIQYNVPEIMDAMSVRRMKQADRDQLISDLGVDAIIEAQVREDMSGTTIMGIGPRHPQAMVDFYVYTKGADRAVWWDGSIKGPASEESVGKTGFFSTEAANRLTRVSARVAFDHIKPPTGG